MGTLSLKHLHKKTTDMEFDVSVTKYSKLKLYRVSQEEWTKLREGVPYVKVYRYNQNTYIQS